MDCNPCPHKKLKRNCVDCKAFAARQQPLALADAPVHPRAQQLSALASAPVHPWLGRRLRITHISHKGQRPYVNAVIVFHDPAESHPFHVQHDDGASAWLAIQESLGVVHAVEGDGGSPRVRTRVSRRFTWLTPVVRREMAGERHPAFGANP